MEEGAERLLEPGYQDVYYEKVFYRNGYISKNGKLMVSVHVLTCKGGNSISLYPQTKNYR